MPDRTRHVEVSSVVAVDGIPRKDSNRAMPLAMAAVNGFREDDDAMRVQTVYDEERARLRIMLLGSAQTSAELLRLVSALLEEAMNAVYRSETGRGLVQARYRELLARWPARTRQLLVPTREGETFVVTCGAAEGPPVVHASRVLAPMP